MHTKHNKSKKINKSKNNKSKNNKSNKSNKLKKEKEIIKKINNLKSIKKNINSIKMKLEEKKMTNIFWIIAERADFKPLTKIIKKNNEEIKECIHSIKELKEHFLDDKGEYYKNKKLASIKIVFHQEIINKLNKLEHEGFLNSLLLNNKEYSFIKEKPILTITINIYTLDSYGNINLNENNNNNWGSKINYFIDDFSFINFKLKNLEILMRMTSDSLIRTDLTDGITYKNLSNKLKKKE